MIRYFKKEIETDHCSIEGCTGKVLRKVTLVIKFGYCKKHFKIVSGNYRKQDVEKVEE